MAKINYRKMMRKKSMRLKKKLPKVSAPSTEPTAKKRVKIKRIEELSNAQEHLSRIRKEKKISMEKLAKHCEISRQSLSTFENKKGDMKLQNIIKLAKYLGLKVYISKE